MKVLKEIMAERERKKYLDKELRVLVEEEKNGYFYGYSENYLRVKLKGEATNLNHIVSVKINSLEKEMLIGDE